MALRQNGHNNFGLSCAASALAIACLFSVTTASAAPLPGARQESTVQEITNPTADTATMPNNPDTPLPDAVSDAIPDDAVAVSSDLAVTSDGTVKDVTTGTTVIDPKLVGTEQAPPDPLAKTDGEKFTPVPITDVKAALNGQGADPASPNDPATNPADPANPTGTDFSAEVSKAGSAASNPVMSKSKTLKPGTTSAAAYATATSATASTATYAANLAAAPEATSATTSRAASATATAKPRITLASLQNNGYGAHWGQYNGSPAFFESDGTLFVQQAKGVVDVSKWQGGGVDWTKAKAAGVQGAIIRLGYGWDNGFDDQALRNIKECKRLGIPFGVYWFSYAENAGNAAAEGADTASLLRQAGVKPGDMRYPVFYDLEKWTWTGHKPPSNPNTYNGIVNAWYAKLQSAGYGNLSLYSYPDYLKTALNSATIHARTRWVASYGPRVGFSFAANDRGWQYTSAGRVSGFAGNVDLNAFGVLTAPAAPKPTPTIKPTSPTHKPTPTPSTKPSQTATPKPVSKGMPVPVYRVYNHYSGLHHYTTNARERDKLVKLGWKSEGTSFKAAKQDSASGLKPVYREYNPYSGNHNWTLSRTEHNKLVKLGWRSEGVAWYASPAGPVTVYRLYNPHSGEHVYTTSAKEYAAVGKAGWHQEGTAWKGL
ncbi:MAG: glycosyl hydrolase family 25 [Bifidobacterium tibiigranuli]|jgi:GH25 family lysozyme M1 (1,4-beta-N-acetylmuramidase)|nr:glycosyl hydrolase family 25 [Bifidobacterium tibiigranuli]